MEASDRGRKHVCPECASRYYDMKVDDPVCPRCGAKPPVAKLQQRSTRRAVRPAGKRFP